MQVTVTFRHVDSTPALLSYAEDKVARMVRKYLKRPGDAHVILSVSKQRHVAEVSLQADHTPLFAKETTQDLYSAIDLAVEKLEHQAQKLKARRSDRKTAGAPRTPPRVVASEAAPSRAVESRRVSPRPMSVDEAIGRLERSADELLVFTDQDDRGALAVVYRSKDGRFGLLQVAARPRRTV
jgi:putative sigma-54 modulation protein